MHGVALEKRAGRAVEIGSYLGRSTALLALAAQRVAGSQAVLTAIDPHSGDRQQLEALGLAELPTYDLFRLHMRGAGVDDVIDVRRDTSDAVATAWDAPMDLLYIDGWHSYDAVLSDINNYASHLSEEGVVCFDDYGNYPEVRDAVQRRCRDPVQPAGHAPGHLPVLREGLAPDGLHGRLADPGSCRSPRGSDQ